MNVKCNKGIIIYFNIENRYIKKFNCFHNIEKGLRE